MSRTFALDSTSIEIASVLGGAIDVGGFVRVLEKGLFFGSYWEESLTDFEGVRRGSGVEEEALVEFLELVHADSR